MTKVAKVNYDEATVARVHGMYQELGNEGLETIAETVGKSVRSVRAKLVRDGLYVAPVKTAATAKAEGPTKKELLIELAKVAPFEVVGFDGATKDAITNLIAAFAPKAEA